MIDDIRYLIVFAKIVEAGSISGGAEALGLTTERRARIWQNWKKIWVVLCYIEIPGNSL